ncbi:hypothetical protein QOZ80_4AG0306520 [Eleusine coracana subsp. coracana]|nr:hypothetical protein QOZ80_4AG0306520 [Eleusine coracana subsp. coracana]
MGRACLHRRVMREEKINKCLQGCWEESVFSREGKAVGMVADMPPMEHSSWRGYAVYWRDAVYVQCNDGESIVRISLSNDKYRVIEMPSDVEWTDHSDFYLRKSEKGLSFASFHDWYDLWVWVHDESHDQIEWVLRHQIDMTPILCVLDYDEQIEGPWILQDVSNNKDDDNPSVKEKNLEWDSDNDDVINVEYEAAQRHHGEITVLGFHPYKDVVFLNVVARRAVAYHLNCLVVQDLGNISPKDYDAVAGVFAEILMSFPYTPCLMEFPDNNLEGHDQD